MLSIRNLTRNVANYMSSIRPSYALMNPIKECTPNYYSQNRCSNGNTHHLFADIFSENKFPVYRFFMNNRFFSSNTKMKMVEETKEDDVSDDESESSPEFYSTQVVGYDEVDAVNDELVDEDGGGRNFEEGCLREAGADLDVEERKRVWKKSSELVSLIRLCSIDSVSENLNKWLVDGNVLEEGIVPATISWLRSMKRFRRALEFCKWVEVKNADALTDFHYATQLSLLAKVHGLQVAETYMREIPPSMQTERIYLTMLASYVSASYTSKAEELSDKMKNMGFPLSSLWCNQMLLLYKRQQPKEDMKKIMSVLLLMEREGLKPTELTYSLLFQIKSRAGDMEGMEQLMKKMKSDGIRPCNRTWSFMARRYIEGNRKDKALAVVKEMEASYMKVDPTTPAFLLPLYASLGKTDEVLRLWNICEPKPSLRDYAAAVEAWGCLGNIEKAEAAFQKGNEIMKTLPEKMYVNLLKLYTSRRLINKGNDLVKQMTSSGCFKGSSTWDAIVRFYVYLCGVEKADTILTEAVEKFNVKPMYDSYMLLLEKYAEKGDVRNAERIFTEMKRMRYNRIRVYSNLLQAYINAKVPAHGFRERLKTDNVFPGKTMAVLLAQSDILEKSV